MQPLQNESTKLLQQDLPPPAALAQQGLEEKHPLQSVLLDIIGYKQ